MTALVLPPSPRTELHHVAFRTAAVEPGMVEVAPEPVRVQGAGRASHTSGRPSRGLTNSWMAWTPKDVRIVATAARQSLLGAGLAAWLAVDVVK